MILKPRFLTLAFVALLALGACSSGGQGAGGGVRASHQPTPTKATPTKATPTKAAPTTDVTFDGYKGIRLGESVRAAAAHLGYKVVNPCRVQIIGTPRGIEITGDQNSDPAHVEQIVIYKPGITGPRGVQVGDDVAGQHYIPSAAHRGLKGDTDLANNLYWLEHDGRTWFWIRAEYGKKIDTFGVTLSRGLAVAEATTQGGCY